jgi:hypothetical protein
MCALPHGGWPATADELRAMADEVERLRAAAKPDPLRAVLERVPATGAPFELSYHPSDVGDPGWTSVVAGYVDYGTLPDVLRAMVGRVSDG